MKARGIRSLGVAAVAADGRIERHRERAVARDGARRKLEGDRPAAHGEAAVRAEGSVERAGGQLGIDLLDPLRRLIPRVGMVDITPMIAILVLYGLLSVLDAGARG